MQPNADSNMPTPPDRLTVEHQREVHRQEVEAYHRRELDAARPSLKPGEVVLHVFDEIAFASTKDSPQPVGLDLPGPTADVSRAYENDFNNGGHALLGASRELLANAARGKDATGQHDLAAGDVGFGYFSLLQNLVEHIKKQNPRAPDGHKANVFLHVAPGLRNVDFPMLYDLMNLAGVTGFERTDLRWLEVAERSTGPSALESAVHHVRDLEKCSEQGSRYPCVAGPVGQHEGGLQCHLLRAVHPGQTSPIPA